MHGPVLGDPRLPHLAACPGHPRASRGADLRRRPAGARAATRRGRARRRDQRRLLQPARTRETTNASPEILDAIARTLQLDPTEHDHLFDLFASTRRLSNRSSRRAPQLTVRPTLQRVIDGLHMPAFVESPRMDILAANHLGRALYTWPGEDALVPFNVARYLFLDPRAATFYLDWESMARNQVALLRTETGREPSHPELIKLIGELHPLGEVRALWAAHDVRKYREGPRRFRHPIVGDLEFIGESLDVSNTPGLFVLPYTIEPGSPTAEAMALLASWAASPPDRHAQQPTQPTIRAPPARCPDPGLYMA